MPQITKSQSRFNIYSAALPLAANNCGFVGSVFGVAQDCDTFRHFNIVQAEGHCYGDFMIWDPTATGPNHTAGTGTQGDWIVLSDKVAIGCNAGLTGQNDLAIAIGVDSGNFEQSTGAIAIGTEAGNVSQQLNAIAIGSQAAFTNQGDTAIAIGSQAGEYNQAFQSVAIGYRSGQTLQSEYSIAVGRYAGRDNQKSQAIAIGRSAGRYTQGYDSVAIGSFAGSSDQGTGSIAVGYSAGDVSQGENSIAIGYSAAVNSQQNTSIAIGYYAGNDNQQEESIAIGHGAGQATQGDHSIAIGTNAGFQGQLDHSIAIGENAGGNTQGQNAIAIGSAAGQNSQGSCSIAIGYQAGINNQGDNCIIINAQGVSLDAAASGCYIAPINENTGPKALIYEPSTKEVRFGDYLPPGVVLPFAGPAAPYGFLLCDGSYYSTSAYPTLFSVIGYNYGEGEGDFAVPNMMGNVPVGRKATQAEFATLGQIGGEINHTLTTNEMPVHNHGVTDPGHNHTYLGVSGQGVLGGNTDTAADEANRPIETSGTSTTGISINNTGGGEAHNNLQPYLVMNYIIKF